MICEILFPSADRAGHWVKVGEEDIDVSDFVPRDGVTAVTFVAERAFAHWNNGSGSESAEFRKAACRSLSMGDVILMRGWETALRCESMGWSQVTLGYANIHVNDGNEMIGFNPKW